MRSETSEERRGHNSHNSTEGTTAEVGDRAKSGATGRRHPPGPALSSYNYIEQVRPGNHISW